jgi:2,5-diketo-D-gluconate reductase B
MRVTGLKVAPQHRKIVAEVEAALDRSGLTASAGSAQAPSRDRTMKERNGIPMIGFGTSGLGDKAHEAIGTALEVGYRHLDTAQSYGTEETIGRVLRDSGLPRSEVFLTTKIADANLAADRFMPSLRQSLDRLGTDYVDLLLIHWPSPDDAVPLADYMTALAEAKTNGRARLIGVSNFTTALLDKSMAILGPGALATNQVEMHPHFHNRTVLAWCDAHGIAVTAYMPLGLGRVLSAPALAAIAARTISSPAQVALAWLIQQGVIVIPASKSRAHMEANLTAADITLSDAEMAAMARTDRNHRMINPAKSPVWD